MLQVTDSAARVVEDTRSAGEVPDTYGLRVFAQPDDNGQPALALAFTEEPVEGDQVIERSGTEIYVAPELAEPLQDSVLDVQDTPEGPQFTVGPQPQEP